MTPPTPPTPPPPPPLFPCSWYRAECLIMLFNPLRHKESYRSAPLIKNKYSPQLSIACLTSIQKKGSGFYLVNFVSEDKETIKRTTHFFNGPTDKRIPVEIRWFYGGIDTGRIYFFVYRLLETQCTFIIRYLRDPNRGIGKKLAMEISFYFLRARVQFLRFVDDAHRPRNTL